MYAPYMEGSCGENGKRFWLTRQAAEKCRPQGQHFAMTHSICGLFLALQLYFFTFPPILDLFFFLTLFNVCSVSYQFALCLLCELWSMAISVGKIYFCFDFPYSHTTLFCVSVSIRPCCRENNYGFKLKFCLYIFKDNGLLRNQKCFA